MDLQEVEWQFDADDLGAVEGWLGGESGGAGLYIEPGSSKEISDIYYDTEDWRLYRAGYALRVRKAGSRFEATMKSLDADVSGGAVRRREISEPARGGKVEALLRKKRLGPVGERVRALAGDGELRPLFGVRTHRRTFDLFERTGEADGGSGGEIVQDAEGNVRYGEGRTAGQDGSSVGEVVQDASGDVRRKGVGPRVGEVALDDTRIMVDGDERAGLARVEIEADPAAEAENPLGLLEDFAETMEEKFGLRAAGASKFEFGLMASGLSPEDASSWDLGPTAVDGSLSAGEVAFRALRRQFAVMRAHEPGVRLGEDPEELHDMRVATRRMRAALKVFESALPEHVLRFGDELKYFAGVMGDVRDLDVQIEGLGERAADDDERPLEEAAAALEERRLTARERLLEALDSDRYERFESLFAEVLRDGPEDLDGDRSVSGEPILAAAPGLLSRPYRKWRKAAGRVDATSDPEEYHDLRKKGKRLRYALEFLSGAYEDKKAGGKAFSKLIKPLKELQDSLGDHQDRIVAAELLERLAADEGLKLSSRAAFAMGVAAERDLREAAALRSSLPASGPFRTLKEGKVWKDLEKDMEKRRRSAKKKTRKGK